MFCSTIRVGHREVHGSPAAKVFKVAGFILLGLIGVTALAIIFGLIVMWLWNALMPDIFNLPQIGYWQAVGLVVLAHIFFGHDHKSNIHRKTGRKNRKNKGNIHIEAGGASVDVEKDFDSRAEGTTDKQGREYHYDSFREFWNGYGRDAFDKWLNRKDSTSTKATDTE